MFNNRDMASTGILPDLNAPNLKDAFRNLLVTLSILLEGLRLGMKVEEIYRRDLNLLVALQVLVEERSVSRAAARLNLSQSAMSRVLGRLRSLVN